jgi:hypothetical protein
MGDIEADYLVVGAGASGMAFVDSILTESDADVVMVDRRHRPGGHWLDAYSFVRLHQPSAYYGVSSRTLGDDRIDETGPNAGFYERATATEICAYYAQVLEQDFLPSGRVTFLGMHDYRGVDGDGHHVTSLLTGTTSTVTVRRRLVDATYIESQIPSRHTPGFAVGDGVRLIPPNDLVDLSEAPSGYVVIGCGKTAMDTCNWLLDEGVDPDAITWIKTRDGWFLSRRSTQPLELVGSFMELQARLMEGAATAEDAGRYAHHLEDTGMFVRVDPTVEPEVFRGATVSSAEVDALRRIERIVRLGRVRRVGTDRIDLVGGSIDAAPGQVLIDCTAAGTPPTPIRPIFERDRVSIQYVTLGLIPWGAATIGAVEALRGDDADRNGLCPPVPFTGDVSNLFPMVHAVFSGTLARGAQPDIAGWLERTRLNPTRGVGDRLDDPQVAEALALMGSTIGAAMRNLGSRVAA